MLVRGAGLGRDDADGLGGDNVHARLARQAGNLDAPVLRLQGASLRDIDHAMERYADSMIADAIYEVESELQREIETQDPL
jgi:hypothetical protein